MDISDPVRLGYSLGWSFTPLSGKRPVLDGWTSRERETLEEALQWASQGNVGLRTGRISGVVVVDLDPSKSQIMPDDLPPTVTARTGRGGWHLYYKSDRPVGNSVGKIGPGIDIRGDGGQVVYVGSTHADTGDPYVWAEGKAPGQIAMAAFPVVELEAMRLRFEGASVRSISTTLDISKHQAHRIASTIDKRAEAYGQRALQDECSKLANAPQGERNNTLNICAFKIGRLVGSGVVDRLMAERMLLEAARQCGLDDFEIAPTLSSGIEAGMKQPRPMPEPKPQIAARPQASAPLPQRAQGYVLVPGQHIDENGELHEIGTDQFVEKVVASLPADALYLRGGVPGEVVGDPGSCEFRVANTDTARYLVDRHMRLGAWVAGKKDNPNKLVFRSCTRDIGSVAVSNFHRCTGLRRIDHMVSHPIYGPQYKLMPAGWCDGVYYDEPASLSNLAIERDIEKIRATLLDLVVDFPFANESSRHNFFGLMLTPLLQPAIDGNRPMHLVAASLERTGKTKLVEEVLGGVVLGKPTPVVQFQGSDEERDKRILMLLMKGEALVHLDNLRHHVDSASLASLLTSSTYKGRVLGSSMEFSGKNNLVLVGSGNNVEATGEIAKRIVFIELQPANDSPESRDNFVHPELRAFVASQRRVVLSCLLGMVENWKACGQPRGKTRMGGFEEWSATIGGIMALHGFDQWMGNWMQWRERATPEANDMRDFVAAWWETHRNSPVLVNDLVEIASQRDVFHSVLCIPSQHGRAVAMSKRYLRPHIDTPIGEYRIRSATFRNSTRFFLERVNGN